MQRLAFQASASSEARDAPARSLETPSRASVGWTSHPDAPPPHGVTLAFAGAADVECVQLLLHELRVPTRFHMQVEFAARPGEFVPMGWVAFEDNARTGFKARELVSVELHAAGALALRLVAEGVHANAENPRAQVSLVGVNVLGERADARPARAEEAAAARPFAGAGFAIPLSGEDEPVAGAAHALSPSRAAAAHGAGAEPVSAALLRRVNELRRLKEDAAAREAYDEAKQLRAAEMEAQRVADVAVELEEAKVAAVARDDYDEAKRIKAKLDAMRAGRALPVVVSAQPANAAAPASPGLSSTARGGGGRNGESPDGAAAASQGGARAESTPLRGGTNPAAVPLDERPLRGGVAFTVFDEPTPASRGKLSPPLPAHRKAAAPGFVEAGAVSGAAERAEDAAVATPGGRSQGPASGPGSAASRAGALRSRASAEGGVGNGTGMGGGDDAEDGSASAEPAPRDFWGALDPDNVLPTAEPLSAPAREESRRVIAVFGEYTARCIHSSHVKLRVAVLTKVEAQLKQRSGGGGGARGETDEEAEAALQLTLLGLQSTGPLVFVAAVKLLETALQRLGAARVASWPHVASLCNALADMLGSTHQLADESAHDALLRMSAVVGYETSARALMRPASVGGARGGAGSALASAAQWRPLHAKVCVLAELLPALSAQVPAGEMDRIFEWMLGNRAFEHPNAAVRDAARGLMVELHALQSPDEAARLESLLRAALRPGLFETYVAGFSRRRAAETGGGGGGGFPATAARAAPAPAQVQAPRNGAAEGAREERIPAEETDDECEFCGVAVPRRVHEGGTTEMDLHHWAECLMLTACTRCQLVVEIAELNEHLLTTCEMRSNHRACPRCGEAISAQFFEQHVGRNRCAPQRPLSEANRCPLCHVDIAPRQVGWLAHLVAEPGCPKNPRGVHEV